MARKKNKKEKQAFQVIKIKTGENIFTKDNEIVNEFQKFYEILYTKHNTSKEAISEFLVLQKLNKISEQQREMLNKEISTKEIEEAIKRLKPNKAQGPDGLTALFYKAMKEEITPFLKRMMNKLMLERTIPETWREANMTMIHKGDTDTSEVKNYRPISLLNIDYKTFSNILAERLKKKINVWIDED